jgi:hypothetical protein
MDMSPAESKTRPGKVDDVLIEILSCPPGGEQIFLASRALKSLVSIRRSAMKFLSPAFTSVPHLFYPTFKLVIGFLSVSIINFLDQLVCYPGKHIFAYPVGTEEFYDEWCQPGTKSYVVV